jgi:hypothetical protein
LRNIYKSAEFPLLFPTNVALKIFPSPLPDRRNNDIDELMREKNSDVQALAKPCEAQESFGNKPRKESASAGGESSKSHDQFKAGK